MGNHSSTSLNKNYIENVDYDDDDEMMIRDGSQVVITSIPNEVKPRPKIGRNKKSGKSSASGSKSKNESLRSALSAEMESQEIERIRREFDLFSLNKENELLIIKKKEKKLETENKKLKTELQALQKTCKKLRDERDFALDAEQRAMMRASAIENDRDKIQRQFKIFREMKECELQSLLKAKRTLENRLSKFELNSVNTENFLCENNDKEQINVKERDMMNNTGWLAMNERTNEHISSNFSNLQQNQQIPEKSSDILELSINNYNVSGLKNSSNVINIFVLKNGDLPAFSSLLMNFESSLLVTCSKLFYLCDIWIFEYDDKIRDQILRNISELSNHDFLAIIALFGEICMEKELSDDHLYMFQCHDNEDIQLFFNSIETFILKEIEAKDAKYMQYCLNYLGWDNIWLWQGMQDVYLDSFNKPSSHIKDHLCQNLFKPYFDQLTNHVTSSGPLPPLLVESGDGMSSSELLVNWMDSCKAELAPTFIMKYFLISDRHSSSDPCIVIKCLMFQVLQCLLTPFALTSDPNQLISEFPKWLDKVSVLFPGGLLLIIDQIDYIENFEAQFDWLMEPLPSDLRIIISTNQNSCPTSWRTWPTVKVSAMQQEDVKQLFDIQSHTFDSYNLEHGSSDGYFNELLNHLMMVPQLCHLVVVEIVSKVLSTFKFHVDDMLVLNEKILNCRSFDEFYELLFDVLELKWKDFKFATMIVSLISISRNGLSEFDLFKLSSKYENLELLKHERECNDYSNNNKNNKNNDDNNKNINNNNDNNSGDILPCANSNETVDLNSNKKLNFDFNLTQQVNNNDKHDIGEHLKIDEPMTKVNLTCQNIYDKMSDNQQNELKLDDQIINCINNHRLKLNDIDIKLWFKLHSLLSNLVDLRIIKLSTCGLYILHNNHVFKIIKKHNKVGNNVSNMFKLLQNYFKEDLYFHKSVDEILWMKSLCLKKSSNTDSTEINDNNTTTATTATTTYSSNSKIDTEKPDENCDVFFNEVVDYADDGGGLQKYLTNTRIVVILLERGLSNELFKYWNKLNTPISIVAKEYTKELTTLESSEDLPLNHHLVVAHHGQLLGKFFMDYGCYEQASTLFQRSLEFLETQLDPDDPKIGHALDLLSRSHEKLGNKGTSEALHMQALEIFRGASQHQRAQTTEESPPIDGNPPVNFLFERVKIPSVDVDYKLSIGPNNTSKSNSVDYTNNNFTNDNNNSNILCTNNNNTNNEDNSNNNNNNNSPIKNRYNFLVASQLDALATLYHRQGKLDRAENFIKRAVSLRKKLTKRVTFAQQKLEP